MIRINHHCADFSIIINFSQILGGGGIPVPPLCIEPWELVNEHLLISELNSSFCEACVVEPIYIGCVERTGVLVLWCLMGALG